MNSPMQIREGIETPILLKQGIDVKALILNTDGNTNEAFLLDGVSDEWAAKLPAESFLKLGPKRFITTKPIKSLSWESIFPGVQTQYTQPSAVKAPKAGKTINVPNLVKDVIEALTDEQIKALIINNGDQSYVASYDVYRFSSTQGQIEKSFVPVILEVAAKKVLEDKPHEISVIAFLNNVYRLTGSEKVIDVDSEAIFQKLAELGNYEDEALIEALPEYLSSTPRIYCWVNKSTLQVISFNDASRSLSFNNFDSLGACFKFCSKEGFVLTSTDDQVESLKQQYISFKKKNHIGQSEQQLQDLLKSLSSMEVSPTVRVVREGDSFRWACSEFRLVQTWEMKEVTCIDVPAENWLNKLTVADEKLRYLIWGAQKTSETSQSTDLEDGELILPPVEMPSEAKWGSRIARRSLVSKLFIDTLYENSSALPLAHKILLFHVYQIARVGFEVNVQNYDSTVRYLSALKLFTSVVCDCKDEHILSLCAEVVKALIGQGILANTKSIALRDTVTDLGDEFFSCAQLSDLRSKQAFIRCLLDIQYQKKALEPKMAMNWPVEQNWWVDGFDIDWSSDGWIASRNGRPVIFGNKSKEDVSKALLKRVIPMRISPSDSSFRYYSQKMVSYPLQREIIEFPVWNDIDVFHIRPDKSKPFWKQSSAPVIELIHQFESDVSYSFESYVSGALEDLMTVCGISREVLNINGELSIHVTGEEANPEIVMWTSTSMEYCSIGGVANAWAKLYFDSIVDRSQLEDIYFPDAASEEVSNLFQALSLTEKLNHVPTALFDFDNQIRNQLTEVCKIELETPISQMQEAQISELLIKLGALNEVPEVKTLVSGIELIRNNAVKDSSTKNLSFNDYIKANIKYAQETGDKKLVQGRSLFARLFEAWCEDCFISEPNHFLVYGTLNQDRMGVQVYPNGSDRYKANCAFDDYFV